MRQAQVRIQGGAAPGLLKQMAKAQDLARGLVLGEVPKEPHERYPIECVNNCAIDRVATSVALHLQDMN